MKLHPLKLKDKPLIDKLLVVKSHKLSSFSFAGIFINRPLLDFFWAIEQDNLCIFAKDKSGWFLYLPPLGKKIPSSLVMKVFAFMDDLNENKNVSRIENIEEGDLDIYRELGLKLRHKDDEYVCLRKDLVLLKGDRFKPKRAACNYFVKNYTYQYLPFDSSMKKACLELCKKWIKERKAKYTDSIYQAMLGDSLLSQKITLYNFSSLGLVGRVIEVNNRIKGYSLGFRLNKDTFCVLFETTDLAIKGLACFIFRQFCRELVDFKYINIMDDSGLDNLRRVKLSYRPIRKIPAYIATRN